MKIYSWNVNGIRAVHRKGALDAFLKKENPDILLIQEIKAKEEQLPGEVKESAYIQKYNPAEKPGYSGVALWVHKRNEKTIKEYAEGMPGWKDTEGRLIRCELTDGTVIMAVYVPNGGKSEEAYREKLQFFTGLASYAESMRKEKHKVIIAGDFNVARSELDLAEPEKHRDHTHFNEEVRAHMEQLVKAGLIDTYRTRNPDEKGAYTYWDNFSFSLPRGTKPRDVNKGWRLDYIMVDPETDKKVTDARIHAGIPGSDHCPVSITL